MQDAENKPSQTPCRDESGAPGPVKPRPEEHKHVSLWKISPGLLQVLLDMLPVGISVYDPGFCLRLANKKLIELMGLEDAAQLQNASLLNDPQIPQSVRQKILAGKPAAFDTSFDFDMLKTRGPFASCRSGMEFFRVMLTPFGEGGAYPDQGWLVIVLDITDAQKAQKKLRENEIRFRSVVETADEIIIITGSTGTILYWNPAAEAAFGYSPGEILGKPFFMLMPPHLRMAHETQDPDTPHNFDLMPKMIMETTGARKDGSEFPLEFSSAPWTSGDAAYRTLVMRDISRRKRDQEQLAALNENLEREVARRTAELETIRRNLEETNIALNILLEKRIQDKHETEQRLRRNVKDLILPMLALLKQSRLDPRQQSSIEMLEANIEEVFSPFTGNLVSSAMHTLSPSELQIAAMIREGKRSKEIADVLGLSKRTIDAYRQKIKNKLVPRDSKINLRTYLLSIA